MKKKIKQPINSRTDFFYYTFRNILLVFIPLLIASGLVLSHLSLHSSAVSSASLDNLTLSIPVSCTMSSTINTPHSISMINGQYQSNIGKTTLDTTCNDTNGFVVYAIGSSGGVEGDNKLKIMGLSSDYNIVSGTATSGDTSNWAMKLTAVSNGNYTPTIENSYDTYSIVPTTWTKVVSKNPTTTDITKKISFTTTYAIYLENSQSAGTYSGQVKYAMFHPSTAVAPTDTIEHAFALSGKQKLTIYNDPSTNTNTTSSTNPTTGEDNTLIGSFYKMQDIDSNICNNTTLVDEQNTLQLVDIRDYKIYWVTKLQDGHCWMTQNLDLDLSHQVALTSNDTDLNDNSLSGAYSLHYSYDSNTKVITWTPENTTRNYTTGTGTAWNGSYNTAYSLDPGLWYWNSNDDTPNCNYLDNICEDFSQIPYSNNGTYGHVGNYYNWSAAIASDDSSVLTAGSYGNAAENPQNSICPKGWRLPTISSESSTLFGSTNEFSVLNVMYNANNKRSDLGLIEMPLYFVRSGYISGNLSSSGEVALYNSSTYENNTAVYGMYFAKDNSLPAAITNGWFVFQKSLGRPIRCLAR